jgi:hypothetical protein
MAWPFTFWIVATRVGVGCEPTRCVEFPIQHPIAHQRPAAQLVQRDVQPFLFVEAERFRGDQRRGAGDRQKADVEVALFELRGFRFCESLLERRDRQHAVHGGDGRALSDRTDKGTPHRVAWKECPYGRCFDGIAPRGFVGMAAT